LSEAHEAFVVLGPPVRDIVGAFRVGFERRTPILDALVVDRAHCLKVALGRTVDTNRPCHRSCFSSGRKIFLPNFFAHFPALSGTLAR